MKTILILLSFMFVSSCVTANTESRDLSGVNEKPDQKQTLIEDKKRPLMLVDDYEDCMTGCEDAGGTYKRCHKVCKYDNIYGTLGAGDRLSSQSPKESKKPLMLADYTTCMYGCQRDGGSEEECHDVCRTDWRCIRDRPLTCPFAQKPTENKKPLKLAISSYVICMNACQRDGGTEEDCHYVCSERWKCEKRGTCR